jgi:hypothetical protein
VRDSATYTLIKLPLMIIHVDTLIPTVLLLLLNVRWLTNYNLFFFSCHHPEKSLDQEFLDLMAPVEWYSADGETGTAIIWRMASLGLGHLHSRVDGLFMDELKTVLGHQLFYFFHNTGMLGLSMNKYSIFINCSPSAPNPIFCLCVRGPHRGPQGPRWHGRKPSASGRRGGATKALLGLRGRVLPAAGTRADVQQVRSLLH